MLSPEYYVPAKCDSSQKPLTAQNLQRHMKQQHGLSLSPQPPEPEEPTPKVNIGYEYYLKSAHNRSEETQVLHLQPARPEVGLPHVLVLPLSSFPFSVSRHSNSRQMTTQTFPAFLLAALCSDKSRVPFFRSALRFGFLMVSSSAPGLVD